MRPPTAKSAECFYEAKHVLLVGSGGGHLSQLLALRPWWEQRKRTWVTFDTDEARSRLTQEEVIPAFHPTTRSIPNLLRNFVLAARTVPRTRPDLVISTGAAVAFPFFCIAKALGIPSVYIEVCDRLESPTLTGRLCYRLSSVFLVQFPEQQLLYPRAQVVGALI